MEKMTKKDKFKKFVHDHREAIAQVAVYTTILVGSIVIIAKETSRQQQAASDAMEEYNSWVDNENAWLDEKREEGKDVYLLHDRSYLFIPVDTEREWINDRIR